MPQTQQGLADAGRGGNEILLNLRGRNADECGQLHNAPSQTELTCVNCEALRGWYQETRRGCACAAVESSFPLSVCPSPSPTPENWLHPNEQHRLLQRWVDFHSTRQWLLDLGDCLNMRHSPEDTGDFLRAESSKVAEGCLSPLRVSLRLRENPKAQLSLARAPPARGSGPHPRGLFSAALPTPGFRSPSRCGSYVRLPSIRPAPANASASQRWW